LARLSASPETNAARQLEQDIAEAGKRLSVTKHDNSIAQLFLQRAEFLAKDKESDSTTKAAVIIGQVLPAYYAARETVTAAERKPRDVVTVTLVRWPYT
jgi:hypothetical protein